MIKEDNELEELIFDYLEGNLSREERNAFELRISGDQDLQEHVDLWKMTFVEEALPDTNVLEDTLFKYHKKSNWAFSLNSFFFLGFLFFLIPVSLEESFVTQPERNSKTETETFLPLEEKSVPKIKENKLSKGYVKTTNKLEIIKPVLTEKSIEKEERTLWDLTQISNRHTQQSQSFAIDNEIDKRIIRLIRKKGEIHLLTKKELRDFNRKKKKSREKKAEMEFLKGRIPYVVPLDSKNF